MKRLKDGAIGKDVGLRKNKKKYLAIAYLTAFIGGFCVMVVELIAGRLIARYLGVSLYTWTSVIGVVLAGISFGNYFGGRIADKFHPRRSLSLLFILASVSCVFVPVLNNLMGNVPILLQLSWPVRITIHVGLIFFLPSCVLGMISPVVAKFALDQGLTTGRTIGNIYAWSAAGSIAGTFVTGFFLIAHIGSIAVVWIIAGVLGVIGLLYGKKNVFAYVWITILIFLIFVSFSPLGWANTIATKLFLKETNVENVVYEKDSQYSYIRIVKKREPGVYEFMLDGLTHSMMNLDEPTNTEYIYGYHKAFVDIAKNFGHGKKNLSVLILGGGGYVLPHYIEKYWPDSHIEVVEIDPEVTKAAVKAFGFPRESNVEIHHLDARNYIEDLIKRKQAGEKILTFDFIYGDVVFGLAVPYHLTTYEFNEKIAQVLAPNGIYTMVLVDSKKSQKFLKAMVDTVSRTFPYVYVINPEKTEKFKSDYETYIVIASLNEIDKRKFLLDTFSGELLSEDELRTLRSASEDIILTDNFAPVDNLLKETFCMQGERMICNRVMRLGEKFIEERDLEKAISQFKKTLRIDPDFAEAYSNIGSLNAWQKRYGEAIEYYRKALDIEPRFKPAMIGLASALDRKGKIKEAMQMYYKVLEIDPNLASVYVSLGNVLFNEGKIDEAINNYEKALEIEPKLEVAQKNLRAAQNNRNKAVKND